MRTSYCQPIRILDPGCWYKFAYWMTNSAALGQLVDLDLHCLQRQGMSRTSRAKVKGSYPLMPSIKTWSRMNFDGFLFIRSKKRSTFCSSNKQNILVFSHENMSWVLVRSTNLSKENKYFAIITYFSWLDWWSLHTGFKFQQTTFWNFFLIFPRK